MIDLACVTHEHLDDESRFLRTLQVRRAAEWLAIGLVGGALIAAHFISIDERRLGTTWQPLPLVCGLAVACGYIGIGVMFQVHKDERRSVWWWWIFTFVSYAARLTGDCTPQPLIRPIGAALNVTSTILGTGIVVARDFSVDRNRVAKGYRCLAGFMTTFVPYATLFLASDAIFQNAILKSILLMVFTMMLVSVIIPIAKHALGDFWTCLIPALCLSSELAQCVLLLATKLSNWRFWVLLLLTKTNSTLRNVGVYDKFCERMAKCVGRPLSPSELTLMEEMRSTLSPADNFGEIMSPIVVAVVLTFEALCMASNLISTAPYLSGSGILTVWKDRSGTGFEGETQIMLAIVFFVRVTFYWAEIKIRPRVADYRCAEIQPRSEIQRRPSAVELYYHSAD